jgi:SagB-type dehydrogenase family enzyme
MTREPSSRSVETIRAYHAATCHHFQRFARGPGELDWATQPDPFRRYAGAPLVKLDHVPVDEGPKYSDVFGAGSVAPVRVDRRSISRLFEDALALSAWKQYGDSRWALRVDPSSGNLHPTEGYLLCGPIEGLCSVPMLAHYAPREHALEVRAEVPRDAWNELSNGTSAGSFFVGITSIHWREAWKYGERAYRYCQHDCGHVIACLAIAAAGLGWRLRVCDDLGHDDLALLLGVRDPHGVEAEEPGVLLLLETDAAKDVDDARASVPKQAPAAFARLTLAGAPNLLSPDHVEWNAVEVAAEVSRKPRTSDVLARDPRVAEARSLVADSPAGGANAPLSLRKIIHQRRSAVSFDGTTSISRDEFYRVLASTCRGPARVLPWAPRVHLGLFVHRVRGLDPGLYLLARDPAQVPLLRSAMQKPFEWTKPDGCPDDLALHLLAKADVRAVARSVSCHQEIASDGAFAVAMLAEFDPALERYGAWFYPRLFWECGVVGQVLYLEAEAIGIRATGIGCFFDEPTHSVFGLASARFRSLYHFTMGGPVDDPRLQTWPAYPPRDDEPMPGHHAAP